MTSQKRGEVLTEPPSGEGSFRDFLRWRRHRRAVIREHKRRGEVLPSVHPQAGAPWQKNGDAVVWCGHATTITRLGNETILSDPIWSRRAAHIVRRLTPPAPDWDDLPTVTAVTLSHNHYDHLDAPTIKRLRNVPVLVPKGVGSWFRRRRFAQVHELDWWQTVDVGEAAFTFVPSKHFSGRSPWDRDRSLYGSWVIQARGKRVYHAGDTGYFSGFADIRDRFKNMDVAFMPVGAYEPRWFMKPFHVNPEEAFQAFLDVQARKFVPIHWGTFRLSDEAMDEPPKRIQAAFHHADRSLDDLWLGDLGQRFPLGPEP